MSPRAGCVLTISAVMGAQHPCPSASLQGKAGRKWEVGRAQRDVGQPGQCKYMAQSHVCGPSRRGPRPLAEKSAQGDPGP